MNYYHGSVRAGLTELCPFASPHSNLSEPLVYLTTSRQLALHYIWDSERLETKMPMLDIRRDGVLVFQEMFSGALRYFYGGLSGYIYHCVGDYPQSDSTGVLTCATSRSPVPVVDCESIDDVYERVMQYEQQGTFVYEKFESLPQYRHDLIRGIVVRNIKRENLLRNPGRHTSRFYRDKFPQYWREAEVLDQHGLL